MFGLNEGLNQSTGIEFPIRMLLGILELVWLGIEFPKCFALYSLAQMCHKSRAFQGSAERILLRCYLQIQIMQRCYESADYVGKPK